MEYIIIMIKQYETLYSRDTTGKIREWYQEQDGNKYRTVSGVQGSPNKVTASWTIIDDAKNADNTTEQATKEILAKYKKQLKTGYSDSIGGVATNTFAEPMLAKKLKDREDKVTFPAMLDRKYNGGRVVITKNGTRTRKNETWNTIPHIFEALKPIFAKFPNFYGDGEGYNHEYRFKLNELMSVLNKKKPTAEELALSKKIVEWHCYDGYGFTIDGKEITAKTGCKERREALKKLLNGIKYVVVVDYEVVNSLDELYKVYQTYIDDGYEGAMYRTMNAGYSHNRSSDLLKVKPLDDSEAVITSIHEGDGNWSGVAKTATVTWENKTFDVTFKGSKETLLEILKNKKDWIGRRVVIFYNGLTGKQLIPNFGRIDPANCTPST
jgi:DNA ligase 1